MTTKMDIAFPDVAQIRKGGKKKPGKSKGGQAVEVFGDDLKDRFRVVFYPGVDEKIITKYFNRYETFTPTRIRAMVPFRKVWSAFSSFNETYNGGIRIAQADDEHYIKLRNPLTLEYEIWNGEPFRAYKRGEVIHYERNGQKIELKLKPYSWLRLFIPEVGRLVSFVLRTTSFYDREFLKQQLGSLQAFVGALNGGNAAGIPFDVYRAEREVPFIKGGRAIRIKKWFIHVEADPEWVKAATTRMTNFAFTGQTLIGPVKPQEVETPLVVPDGEDDEDEDDDDESGESPADPSTPTTSDIDSHTSPSPLTSTAGSPADATPLSSTPTALVPADSSTVSTAQLPEAPADNGIAPKDSRDWTTYWTKTVPGLKVGREQATAAVKQANNDAVAAFRILNNGR